MRRLSLAISVGLVAVACGVEVVGTHPVADGGPVDAGLEVSLPEAGVEPSVDAAPEDAGVEAGVADASLDADADAGPPTAVVSAVVAPDTLTVDRASPIDGPVATDGQNDGAFQAVVVGPATAIALLRTDAAGVATGDQIWDSFVGLDPIPASLGTVFTTGNQTFTLTVLEASVPRNDAEGRVSLSAGAHTLVLAGSNVGSFVAGEHFRVVLQAPDGTLVYGPVIAY